MATIELRGVEKRFGDQYAVKPMDLTIESGEFVVLLGPSGCGKTTTLRMISGLEAVTGGAITFDGRDVTWSHPSDRDIAFVCQFFALYSHLTCHDNIAFPLQARGESRGEVKRQVAEVAELLQIGHLLNVRPGALSGGDQQRVALARALVRRPAAFLMDEPLGALDADFRETMRAEIKRLHLEQKATTVYVTHDQIEAMAMGDKIVVMSAAEVQQVGSPADVYYDPANLFVARFIGSPGMNLLSGRYEQGVFRFGTDQSYTVPADVKPALERAIGQGELILGFRPEAVNVQPSGPIASKVYASDLHGGYAMLHLDIGGETVVHARAGRGQRYAMDSEVRFDLDPEQVRFFHPATEEAIRKEQVS
ncbi:MAG: ABC transporter ATP-binding protein [Trueperaceae bacterium]|nr:MAG: ABC transporter ATP-binding protein [Trueperaceae bacterium]